MASQLALLACVSTAQVEALGSFSNSSRAEEARSFGDFIVAHYLFLFL